jgi:hypothetical protein
MRRVPACWRVAAVLVGVVAPALLSAAPAAPEKSDQAVSPVEKLHKDLDKTISIKIEKQPLTIAMDMLHDKSNISFVLDGVTIQQLGFTPDMPPSPVDVDLKDVKVRSALRSILAPYGLSYAPIGDTVVVTTEDMAMLRQMRQRVNVDLSKVELTRALRQLAHDTATNVIVDSRAEKDAQATVTMQLEDVPLETAVRLLAEMANLKPVRVGNVLFVTGKANANEMRADPDIAQPNPNIRTQQEFLQLGGFPPGAGGPVGGIAVPPGLTPAVPPNAVDAPDAKTGESKDQKEEAPKDSSK